MNLSCIEYFVNRTDHGDELTNHIKFERIGVTIDMENGSCDAWSGTLIE
ncbi:hypothetical protein RP726_11745 [Candidatus Methylospira mobilis]|nr:hypothetical protein [Candidatus Methylospira mobilis]WNV03142.1 hypothetical protein RP726_11745 [Candidatus Methylospira mobilis]